MGHICVGPQRFYLGFQIKNQVLSCPRSLTKFDLLFGQNNIQRIFKIYKGIKCSAQFLFIFIFKQVSCENQIKWVDYWGWDGYLDIKIGQISLCHTLMLIFNIHHNLLSYVAYDISQDPCGPQPSHPLIRFWLNNWLRKITIKCESQLFPLY
jgi:hypothetical protein